MLFSLDWILKLCPTRNTPDEIAAALTARGLTVDAMNAHGDDQVLDLDHRFLACVLGDRLGHVSGWSRR